MTRLIVAIPAYNEESALPRVLKEIRKSLSKENDLLILLVDDGSTDSTVEVAKNCGTDIVVSHKWNQGVAQAYKTAICTALSYGADIICTIDGDGQFQSNEIEKLVEPIRRGQADLVIGSRFVGIENKNSVPTLNKIANKMMASFISLIIGKRLHDTESGFRAISREAAKKLQLLGRVSFSNDMIIDLSKKGCRIEEVPVKVKYYKERVSKVITSFLRYGFKSLCLIALKVLYLRLSLKKMADYRPPTSLICDPKDEQSFKLLKTN